jgi:hypothetical protein
MPCLLNRVALFALCALGLTLRGPGVGVMSQCVENPSGPLRHYTEPTARVFMTLPDDDDDAITVRPGSLVRSGETVPQ